jgi:hypothetical protein
MTQNSADSKKSLVIQEKPLTQLNIQLIQEIASYSKKSLTSPNFLRGKRYMAILESGVPIASQGLLPYCQWSTA